MISILLYALLAWFLYKLIFGFIIPVYRTTRQLKKKFRAMHEQMQSQQPGYAPGQPVQPAPVTKAPSGDYIDFEEVK